MQVISPEARAQQLQQAQALRQAWLESGQEQEGAQEGEGLQHSIREQVQEQRVQGGGRRGRSMRGGAGDDPG